MWARLRAGFERERARPVTVEFLVDRVVAGEFRMVVGPQRVTGTEVELVGEPGDRERWRVQLRARRAAMAQALAWAPLVELVAPADLVADVRRQAEVAVSLYPAEPESRSDR